MKYAVLYAASPVTKMPGTLRKAECGSGGIRTLFHYGLSVDGRLISNLPFGLPPRLQATVPGFGKMSEEVTKSARRVFEILELFRRRRRPQRLKDIAEALDLPTSSAAALLKTMAQLNYLSFDSTSRLYLPTLRLSRLCSWVTADTYERGPIQESLAKIGRKTDEAIFLGTVTDIYVEIVDILRANQPLQYYTTIGTKVLLVHSGIGWPLLGRETDEAIARIYRRTIRKKKIERQISSLDRLRAGIERVRRDGYCLSRGMVTRGVGVVGILVPTPPDHRPLAIGVAGPQERIEKNLARILAAVRAEQERLARFAYRYD